MNRLPLRFNFGFLLEADFGTMREVELDYPEIDVGSDLRLSPLLGRFTATRTTEGIYINGRLHSHLSRACERCLKEAIIDIAINLDELYYYPPSSASAGEPTIGEDGHLDLGPLVRELMLLEVPIRIICQSDCQGLCQECGQNLNDADCGCPEDYIDPRLSVLSELLSEQSN